jgi:hypothetical protein
MTRWRAFRLLAALCVVQSACLGQGTVKPSPVVDTTVPRQADSALDADACQQIVDELARNLEAQYLIPTDGARMAALLRKRLAAHAYDALTEPGALAQMLEGDLRTMSSDAHLNVFFSTDPPPTPPPPGSTPSPTRVAELRKKDMHGGIEEVKILPGNIGYLALWGVPMVEVSRDDIAKAFALLHGTAALILDNRRNRGGDPHTVGLYLSYLTEGPPVVYNRLIGRDGVVLEELETSDLGVLSYGGQKPVYVLTSRETFSGGEALSYHLQELKRAVVIGEKTRGGARKPEIDPLGHSLYAMIPIAQARSPFSGGNWEGVGVQPDVLVSAADALSAAQQAVTARLQQSPP